MYFLNEPMQYELSPVIEYLGFAGIVYFRFFANLSIE